MAAPTEGAYSAVRITPATATTTSGSWSAATAADGIVIAVVMGTGTASASHTMGTSNASGSAYTWTAVKTYGANSNAPNFTNSVWWAPALAGTTAQNIPTVTIGTTGGQIIMSCHYYKGAAPIAPIPFINGLNGTSAFTAGSSSTGNSSAIANGGSLGPPARLNGYSEMLAVTWTCLDGSAGTSAQLPTAWPAFTTVATGQPATRQGSANSMGNLSTNSGMAYYQDATTTGSNPANNTVNNVFGITFAFAWFWTTARNNFIIGFGIAPAVSSPSVTSQQTAPIATAGSTGTPTGAVSATGSTTTPVVTIPQTPSGVTVEITSKVTSITASSSSSGLGASLSASTLAPTVAIPATASTPSGIALTTASSLDIAADATNGNVNAGMLTSASTLGINLGIAGVVNRTLVAQATTLAINASTNSQFRYTFTSPQLDDVPQFLPESNPRQVALYRHFKRRVRNLVVALLSDYSTAQDTPSDGHLNSIPYPWNPNDPGGPFSTAWINQYPANYVPGTRPEVPLTAVFTTQKPYVTKLFYGREIQNITYDDAKQLLYNGYKMAAYGSTPQPGQVAIGYSDESRVSYA